MLPIFLLVFSVVVTAGYFIFFKAGQGACVEQNDEETIANELHPLAIDQMRRRDYPGSDLVIERELPRGINYHQYIVSYESDGLKIYGLLTVPAGKKPAGSAGWPVIIFNHGYIPPDQYKTTEGYRDYVDAFARANYIVFKPDYRGHGNSEGEPTSAYYSPAYTVDVLNAVSSLKKYKDADPERIGMWGHSLGGNITLRSLVVSPDIKVAVIWAGVVGTYRELLEKWSRSGVNRTMNDQAVHHLLSIRENLVKTYGSPADNPVFWQSIDPRYYLSYVSAPVQLHHGLSDQTVPWEFSESLKNDLEKEGKTVEFITYQSGDHNISSPNFTFAINKSVDFFDRYLKGGETRNEG